MMETPSALAVEPAALAAAGGEVREGSAAGTPAEAGGEPAVAAWPTRRQAARAAAGFNELVDRYAGQVPAGVVAAYRAACDASPAGPQYAFLVAVAGHLTLHLAASGPDPITRAAELLAVWFLRPR
jgi:hypothetical protein